MTLWPLAKLSRNQQIAAVALVAVVIGALVAPQVYGQTTQDEADKVAVVEVTGPLTSATSQHVEDELREARHNDSVKAVVLDVDSGGGSPGSSERMATAVERTATEMPVIAAVDTIGASGAYYTMLPADEIYVTPTAQVGSVGVVGPAPMPTGPNEGTSGPDKGTFHPDDDRANIETIQQVFLESVMEYRGDDLDKDRETVAHARTYVGIDAVDNGFADEIGMADDAIYEAADQAGLHSFEIVSGLTVDDDEQATPFPLFEANEVSDVAMTDDHRLNPHQPLLVTPELWHDLFDATEFDEEPETPPSNDTATETGGAQP